MYSLFDTLLNGPARWTEAQHMSPSWALIVVLAALLLECAVAYLLLLTALNIRSIIGFILRLCGVGEEEADKVFLELLFPADTSKSAYATEQLHILLRGTAVYPHFWDRLAGRKRLRSLELVSTKDNGIRYIMAVPASEADYIASSLRSYLPGLKVRRTKDYLPAATGRTGVTEFKLHNDFALSLQDLKTLNEHDPIAYLTGHMTKLGPDELIAFQIVVTPVFDVTHPRVVRRLKKLQHRIALGHALAPKLKSQRTPLGYLFRLLWYVPYWWFMVNLKALVVILDFIGILFGGSPSPKYDSKKRRSVDPYERELAQFVKTKFDQHLFEVTIRLLISSTDDKVLHTRTNAFIAALQPFTSNYQMLQVRSKPLPLPGAKERYRGRFAERSLSPHIISQPTILAASELADLYHFPNTALTKTPGLKKSRSRELPVPLSHHHSDTKLDVVVGTNTYGGEEVPIGMTLPQRQKHTYVIGKTGMGKTTLLKSSIYQDMVNDKGLAVLDPHGDMFRELLEIVPKHRRKDVVVFNPADRQYPIGLNILAPGIHFDNEEDAHEWITGSVLSVFAKLTNEAFWGPRMEHILRNVTLTALATENPNLHTLQRLLTDKKYQREVVPTLTDPVLKQFWTAELKAYGDMQLATLVAPLTHRLGHFITTKMSRHILLQPESTISISDIMNERKILLVNLSKGDIGEDQSFFFGTLLTSLIWMAAYQRTKIPERKRQDFFVYVDEFQNFATPQFTDITSEGRKFHVSLIASHQNIAQIEDKSILKIVAGNAASIICLKASPDDEAFILPFMRPEVEKGDIVNLAPHHFFMKSTTDDSEDAFSGTTVPLDVKPSSKVREAVLAYSRKQYATPRKAVEAHMEALFSDKKPQK